MKETLKKIVPESMIAWIRGVQASVKLRRETIRQMKRFERNYAKRGSMRTEHLETRIIFFTHQIEKGLSHQDFRFGFGKGHKIAAFHRHSILSHRQQAGYQAAESRRKHPIEQGGHG